MNMRGEGLGPCMQWVVDLKWRVLSSDERRHGEYPMKKAGREREREKLLRSPRERSYSLVRTNIQRRARHHVENLKVFEGCSVFFKKKI